MGWWGIAWLLISIALGIYALYLIAKVILTRNYTEPHSDKEYEQWLEEEFGMRNKKEEK
jgi:hypothetical protein